MDPLPVAGIPLLDEYDDAPCPICTRTEWIGVGELGNLYVTFLLLKTADGEIVQGAKTNVVLDSVPKVCAHCGYIRLHSLRQLDNRARGKT